jgi:hypothetical protein
LLTRSASLPYPIIYGSSIELRWGKTPKGRISVSNGIDKYLKAADPDLQEWFKVNKENPFQLYCDRRQLPFFQRFLEDWQAYNCPFAHFRIPDLIKQNLCLAMVLAFRENSRLFISL